MAAEPVLLGVVTLLSALHMGYLTRCVGKARQKHKVTPPSVTGPPEFERTFRAHQNCVEFYPIFLTLLWTSGLFCSEGASVVGGLLFIAARQIYFNGYVKASKDRLPGFYLTLAALLTLAGMGAVGLLHECLDEYLDVNLKKMFFKL